MFRKHSRFWIVVTLALCTSFVTASWGRANEKATEFNIPPQSLDSALLVFAKQADVQVSVSTVAIAGMRTEGVVGRFTPSVALARLLTETGLRFTTIGNRTYSVSVATSELVPPTQKRFSGQLGSLVAMSAVPSGAPSMDETTGAKQANQDDGKRDAPEEPLDTNLGNIVVTGTHIRGVAPVGSNLITIDREEIDKSGFTTVTQALQSLPQTFGAGPGEDSAKRDSEALTNSSRGTSINLRGLGVGATLVLLDGRRLAQSGVGGTFTDVSSLPLTAVERIEVLPDGASAIYGSDAVGGVVNIILRKAYQGAETRARFGTLTEGTRNEYQLGQAMGSSWGTGNGLLALEYTKQDALPAEDRPQRGNSDLRPLGGDNFDTRNGNPGTIIIGGQTWAIPRGQDGRSLQASDLVAGTVNLHNRHEGSDYLPDVRRWSAFGTARQNVGESVEVFTDVLYSNRRTEARSPALPITLLVPSTNPFYVNPTGGTGPIRVTYSLLDDLGPPSPKFDVDTYNAALGSEISLSHDWQLTTYLGYGREEVAQQGGDQIFSTALNAALADSNPVTAFNPFGDGSFTNPATLATLPSPSIFATDSNLWSADLKVDGAVVRLPGGELRLAIGADYREQSFDSSLLNPSLALDTRAEFDRNVTAVFAEGLVPLIGAQNRRAGMERLELSLAGRHEKYSDFGETSNPKLGALWSPVDGLAFRGAWSKSFKAPNVADLDESTQNGTVIFPIADSQSASGFTDILLWFGKNADLQEETATTWSIGIDLSPPPLPAFKLSITYFDIEYENRIETLPGITSLDDPQFADFITRNPTSAQRDAACSRGTFFGNFSGIPGDCRTADTVLVDGRIKNVSITSTTGWDLLGSYQMLSSAGTFDVTVNATYLRDFLRAITRSNPLVDQLNRPRLPIDLRLRSSVSWNRGPFAMTTFINYTDSYDDTTSTPNQKIGSWTTVDLQLGYSFDVVDDFFFSNAALSLNVQNALDEDAPFINDPAGIGYDPNNASVLGRLVSLQLRKGW